MCVAELLTIITFDQLHPRMSKANMFNKSGEAQIHHYSNTNKALTRLPLPVFQCNDTQMTFLYVSPEISCAISVKTLFQVFGLSVPFVKSKCFSLLRSHLICVRWHIWWSFSIYCVIIIAQKRNALKILCGRYDPSCQTQISTRSLVWVQLAMKTQLNI